MAVPYGYHQRCARPPPGARPARTARDCAGGRAGCAASWGRTGPPAYLFCPAPDQLLVGIIAWPFLRAIWMSFHNIFGPRWGALVGLRNYTQQLEDPIFWRSSS